MVLVDMLTVELAAHRKAIVALSTDLDLEYGVFTSIKLQDLSTFEKWKDTVYSTRFGQCWLWMVSISIGATSSQSFRKHRVPASGITFVDRNRNGLFLAYDNHRLFRSCNTCVQKVALQHYVMAY